MQKQNKILLALAGTAVDANGTWFDVSEMEFPLAVLVVGGAASNDITIDVTDQYPLPANSVHDAPYGAAIVADGVTLINGPVMGIKARKPAATASTTVYVLARVKRS